MESTMRQSQLAEIAVDPWPIALVALDGTLLFHTRSAARFLESLSTPDEPQPIVRVEESLLNRLRAHLAEDGENAVPVPIDSDPISRHRMMYVRPTAWGGQQALAILMFDADCYPSSSIEAPWADILVKLVCAGA